MSAGVELPSMSVLVPQVYESVRDYARPGNDFSFEVEKPEGRAKWDAKFVANNAKYLPRFEAVIAANPDSDTFTVQASYTLADIALAEALSTLVDITGSTDFLAPYPGVLRLAHAIWDLPAVAAYLKSDKRYPLGDAAYVANVAKVLRW